VLLVDNNKYLACLNINAGKVNVYNVKTGRWMTKVDLERPGQKERDKILAIWKPASDVTTDDKKILAVSEKHLISVQIPQGKILTKIRHQSNFKIPQGSRDVTSVLDSNGQLDRIYYVQSEADRTLSLHSVAMRGGSAGHKKPLRMGQVVALPGSEALYGANEKFVAKVCHAVQGKSQMKLTFMTEDGYSFDSHKVGKSRCLTCLAVDPRDPVVATGDKSGRIAVWRRSEGGADNSGQRFFPTYFHWHSLPVRCLAWAPGPTGSTRHLYSGGEEGAILKWDTRECKKVCMVPRLGATLVSITATADAVAVATEHNTVKMFTANLQEITTSESGSRGRGGGGGSTAGVAGLCADPRKPLFWHKATRTLAALSTKKRQIQLYDPVTRSEAVALDVSAVNPVVGERGDPVVSEDIEYAVSPCGEWVATVEHNWDTMGGNCLKVWQFTPLSTSTKFSLNTKINQPHSVPARTLTFVSLPPDGVSGLLTCGQKKAKLWRLGHNSGQWEPVRSFDYLGREPGAVAQSGDKSILAISFGSSLTLWHGETTAMLTSLSVKGENDMRYSSVAFGQASSCHLVFGTVITGTGQNETVPEPASAVVVWNMVSCRLLYRLSLSPGPARFLPLPMSNNRLCLVHGGGVTTISPDFGLEHVLNLSSECSRVDTAAVNDSGTGIYFLSGERLGHLSLDSVVEDDQFVSDVNPADEVPTALDNALSAKLSISDEQQRDIFYARVSSSFMKPEAVTSRLSAVSAMLLKKSLPA